MNPAKTKIETGWRNDEVTFLAVTEAAEQITELAEHVKATIDDANFTVGVAHQVLGLLRVAQLALFETVNTVNPM